MEDKETQTNLSSNVNIEEVFFKAKLFTPLKKVVKLIKNTISAVRNKDERLLIALWIEDNIYFNAFADSNLENQICIQDFNKTGDSQTINQISQNGLALHLNHNETLTLISNWKAIASVMFTQKSDQIEKVKKNLLLSYNKYLDAFENRFVWVEVENQKITFTSLIQQQTEEKTQIKRIEIKTNYGLHRLNSCVRLIQFFQASAFYGNPLPK